MIEDFFISVLLTEDNQSTNRVPSIVTILPLLQNEREFLFFQGSEFLRSITLLTRQISQSRCHANGSHVLSARLANRGTSELLTQTLCT